MKHNTLPWIAMIIATILFFVPFFWLKPGFVDLGGDGGRLYFLDPLAILKTMWYTPGSYVYSFANIPYLFFLYLLKYIIRSPTQLIAIEHGYQLALSFMGVYLIATEMISQSEKKYSTQKISFAGIISGIVYIGLIAKTGWPASLLTLNQTFLNVLVFYVLFKYCVTRKFVYILIALLISFIFSANFGFGSIPQLLSFFPLAMLFLMLFIVFVLGKPVPIKGLLGGVVLFLGLHAMHVVPVVLSLLTKDSIINNQVFDTSKIQLNGVDYFAANRAAMGKITAALFQSWLKESWFSPVVPAIGFLGFLIRRSKPLFFIGIFFLITLFLVSANITRMGAMFYEKLFYIPGFMMFRSFDEKWHFAYAFFYVLLFGFSLYYLLDKSKRWATVVIVMFLFGVSVWRLVPFLSGQTVRATIYQSRNVSTVFSLDNDLLDILEYIKTLPPDGKVLSLPLSYSYLQTAYGKEGGAYVGISMISQLAGRQDFSGLWSLRPYKDEILSALSTGDSTKLLQLFSYLNIRYVFYNADRRLLDDLSNYYIPGTGDEFPDALKDNAGYEALLASLPLQTKYKKGHYSLYEIDNSATLPLIYITDYVNATGQKQYPSAIESSVSYIQKNPVLFDVTIDLNGNTEPFLLVLSHPYFSKWDLTFDGAKDQIVRDHIVARGYANGWIIDPATVRGSAMLYGRIYLTSQNYFYIGLIISGITAVFILYATVKDIQGKHEAA